MIKTTRAYEIGLGRSRKIRDIAPELELWQIGKDRLADYTSLFSRIYDQHFSYHLERKRSDQEILEVYRGFLSRSVYMGVMKNGSIVTTGTALLAFGRDLPPALPEDVAPLFDLSAMADEFKAPEIWFVSRMAMDKDQVSRRESLSIIREVSAITAETVGGNPRNLMIGVMEENLRRFYRLHGVHWNIIDTVGMPFGDGFRMHRGWVRAEKL